MPLVFPYLMTPFLKIGLDWFKVLLEAYYNQKMYFNILGFNKST
jgi:hypothetical protein